MIHLQTSRRADFEDDPICGKFRQWFTEFQAKFPNLKIILPTLVVKSTSTVGFPHDYPIFSRACILDNPDIVVELTVYCIIISLAKIQIDNYEMMKNNK